MNLRESALDILHIQKHTAEQQQPILAFYHLPAYTQKRFAKKIANLEKKI